MCNTICIWAKCINMFFILSPPGYPTGIFFASIHFYLSISDAFHKYKGSPQHTYARIALFITYIYIYFPNIVYIEQHLPKIHHIDQNKKVAVLQKTLSKSFRKWKLLLFWFILHYNMFLRLQLIKSQVVSGNGLAPHRNWQFSEPKMAYFFRYICITRPRRMKWKASLLSVCPSGTTRIFVITGTS